jgi:hypothetical protein
MRFDKEKPPAEAATEAYVRGTAATGNSCNLIAALASCRYVLKNERDVSLKVASEHTFIPSLKHQPKLIDL